MGKPTTRLKDIANKTGFSVNTVSLALRESPRIPKETRDVIKAAADALNYLPNQIAKSLVCRETKTIGLVLTQITNPILTMTAQAVELALAQLGYATMFATSNNNLDDEKRVLEMLRARQVDGILIYPHNQQKIEHVVRLRDADYPIVSMVGRPHGIDSVGVDDLAGSRKAVEHLIRLGHKRIGLFDSNSTTNCGAKTQGYRDAMCAHGLDVEEDLILEAHQPRTKAGYETMKQLMAVSSPPSALFCSTDSTAIGALKWCRDNGVSVPDDVAIIGYDNVEFAEYTSVPLSSINYDAQRVADAAVSRLMVLIEAELELPQPRHTLIDPDLIARQSTVGT